MILPQIGSGNDFTLILCCRPDRSTSRYKVERTPVSGNLLLGIRKVLGNSNAKLGPFNYSADGNAGAFWYVIKVA
jgi:hypothetical protein